MTNRKRIKTIQKQHQQHMVLHRRDTRVRQVRRKQENEKTEKKKQIIRFAFVFIAIANNERSVYEMQCNLLPNLFDL